MKWIVGLGNPGSKYAVTRHNIGFMALDVLADKLGISINQSKCKAKIGEGQINGEKIVLIQPVTYMNLSGESVRAYMDFYKVQLEDMIVLYDDLDTEFGGMRLRYKGSAGGHNGIKSMIQHLGTQEFNRIRLGISRPPAGYDIADYVLSSFAKGEMEELGTVLERACDAVVDAVHQPFDKVMAKYNS
jgi:PTH1 family peptidyl-tRNA hydrolase